MGELSEAEFWRRCEVDIAFFVERCLFIRVLRGGTYRLIRLELNKEQRVIVAYVQWCIDNKFPVRLIIDKARQLGVSTLVLAVLFWLCSFHPYIRSQIVAHREQSARKIAKIAHLYARKLPPRVAERIGPLPLTKGGPIEWKHDSLIEVVTQGATEASAGDTPSALHLSEFALWDLHRTDTSAEDVLQAALTPIEDEPGTFVAIESTARGMNTFYDRWVDAIENESHPDSIWKPFFFDWLGVPKYTRTASSEEMRDHARILKSWEQGKVARAAMIRLGYNELWLKRIVQFGISAHEMKWALGVLRNKFKGDMRRFDEEFPLSWQLSFVTSSASYFDPHIVSNRLAARLPAETVIGGRLVERSGQVSELECETMMPVQPRAFSWNHNWNKFAVVDDDGCVRVYVPEQGLCKQIFEAQVSVGRVDGIEWSEDGKAVRVCGKREAVGGRGKILEATNAKLLVGRKSTMDDWRPAQDVRAGRSIAFRGRRVRVLGWKELPGSRIELDLHDEGWWIFRHPVPGHAYIVSADAASGTKGGDFACISVFDRVAREFVAEFYAKLAPDLQADQCVLAARWYNDAFLVPEINSEYGGALLSKILQSGYRRIYRRHPERPLSYGADWVQYLGFKTSGGNRGTALALLAAAVISGDPVIYSHNFWGEATTVVEVKGKAQAMKKRHDDSVMTHAIALYADDKMPDVTLTVPEPEKHNDLWSRQKVPLVDPYLGSVI